MPAPTMHVELALATTYRAVCEDCGWRGHPRLDRRDAEYDSRLHACALTPEAMLRG